MSRKKRVPFFWQIHTNNLKLTPWKRALKVRSLRLRKILNVSVNTMVFLNIKYTNMILSHENKIARHREKYQVKKIVLDGF